MPPTRKQSPDPLDILLVATWIASIEEPQSLLKVAPGTVFGNPLKNNQFATLYLLTFGIAILVVGHRQTPKLFLESNA